MATVTKCDLSSIAVSSIDQKFKIIGRLLVHYESIRGWIVLFLVYGWSFFSLCLKFSFSYLCPQNSIYKYTIVFLSNISIPNEDIYSRVLETESSSFRIGSVSGPQCYCNGFSVLQAWFSALVNILY